jgi:hypothetical protein
MRLVLTTILVLASGTAFGSSITSLSGSPNAVPSVVIKHCDDCPAPTPAPDRSAYRVPGLPSGTQKVEVREIDGEKKLVRTEAWLGGSPVTFVSKLQDWEKDSAVAGVEPSANAPTQAPVHAAAPARDGIDTAATTSAVSPERAAGPLAMDHFDLRLNNLN